MAEEKRIKIAPHKIYEINGIFMAVLNEQYNTFVISKLDVLEKMESIALHFKQIEEHPWHSMYKTQNYESAFCMYMGGQWRSKLEKVRNEYVGMGSNFDFEDRAVRVMCFDKCEGLFYSQAYFRVDTITRDMRCCVCYAEYILIGINKKIAEQTNQIFLCF